ncbi:hypothetical protein KFE25_002831 [Diacronema lutheri]|uniref:Uncharacterized protein n=1 Tax=Diacronema lutheri TaxID=2081491 RepID=A0A8J5XLQ6_DIALT|nr:hypothetical protein KFE25_002831 [Diacronema lutheri]
MDTLLEELRVQEGNYYESLVRSAGVEGADRMVSSRSSLRAELERARAEQMRLRDAARAQQAQLELLRAHNAPADGGSLEARALERERHGREEAARGPLRAVAELDAVDGGGAGGEGSARPTGVPPGTPAQLAADVAAQGARLARVERSVDELGALLRAIDGKLSRALARGSPARVAEVGTADGNVRARKTPPSRELFARADAGVSDDDAGELDGDADHGRTGGRGRHRDGVPAAERGAAADEATATHARLSEVSAKYEALKKKFARQTIREAELHGFLIQHGAPSAALADAARRPASERRGRTRPSRAALPAAPRVGAPSERPRQQTRGAPSVEEHAHRLSMSVRMPASFGALPDGKENADAPRAGGAARVINRSTAPPPAHKTADARGAQTQSATTRARDAGAGAAPAGAATAGAQ